MVVALLVVGSGEREKAGMEGVLGSDGEALGVVWPSSSSAVVGRLRMMAGSAVAGCCCWITGGGGVGDWATACCCLTLPFEPWRETAGSDGPFAGSGSGSGSGSTNVISSSSFSSGGGGGPMGRRTGPPKMDGNQAGRRMQNRTSDATMSEKPSNAMSGAIGGEKAVLPVGIGIAGVGCSADRVIRMDR